MRQTSLESIRRSSSTRTRAVRRPPARLPVTAGAGIPIKTLEALALGKAVVATSGALRGLSNGGARALPAFDDAKAFATEIRRLIADPAGREERAQAGKSVADDAYSRSAYYQGWDSVIERLPVGGGGRRPE